VSQPYIADVKVNLGFTLIEVLLAISIFAVISLASFSIFDGVLKSEEYSREKMQRLNEIQRAWLVIERDFLQIAQRSVRREGEAPLSDYLYADNGGFSSSEQAIAFVRSGWTNPGLLIPRSDMQSVAYRVEDKTLERLHYNFVDAVVGEEPKIRPLIANVERFELNYFYQDKWQATLKENNLPQAIELIIETEDFGVINRKFILVDNMQKSTQQNTPKGQQDNSEQDSDSSNQPKNNNVTNNNRSQGNEQ